MKRKVKGSDLIMSNELDTNLKLENTYGEIVEKIASGTYGVVYKSKNNYAIKLMHDHDEDILGSFLIEASVLKSLNHPNIIHASEILLDYKYKNQISPTIIMPLAESNYKDFKKCNFDLESVSDIYLRKIIYYQILQGISFCHKHLIWHLDIKPANILVYRNHDKTLLVKLADFGISEIFAKPSKYNSLDVVTVRWRAPEIILGNRLYDEKVDIWSIAVMFFEEITIKKAHYFRTHIDEKDLIKMIYFLLGTPKECTWPGVTKLKWYYKYYTTKFKHGVLLTKINNKDEDETDLLTKLMAYSNKRATAQQALAHNYFNSVRNLFNYDCQQEDNRNYSNNNHDKKTRKSARCQPFLKNHPELNQKKRKHMFEWLFEVSEELSIRRETLFYAYDLIDYYLSMSKNVELSNFQLLGLVGLLISSTFFEIYPLEFKIVNDIDTSHTYTKKEIESYFKIVLTALDYNLITTNTFEYFESSLSIDKPSGLSIMVLVVIISNYPEKTAHDRVLLALKYLKSIDNTLEFDLDCLNLNLDNEFLAFMKEPFCEDRLNRTFEICKNLGDIMELLNN